jgi:oligopeptide/dipeptide ABC transporter ATP-binding protein
MTLLRLRGLAVTFRGADGPVRAVRGVDLDLDPGEALAIVGESGSGKSATALALIGLLGLGGDGAGAEVEGSAVWADGTDLLALPPAARRRGLAMVFQEPMTALNPVLRIGTVLAEAAALHGRLPRAAAAARAEALLAECGLPDPRRAARAYPHELSGGMRQRALIALALACAPRLLIADEPTTALDAAVQGQVLDLLAGLRRRHGMALLLVTHDFGVVARAAGRVAVMYAGRVVETAPAAALLRAPLHPYAAALLAAVPRLDLRRGEALPTVELPGAPPDPRALPPGCAFHPRCRLARPGRCDAGPPPALLPRGPDRAAACHELPA